MKLPRPWDMCAFCLTLPADADADLLTPDRINSDPPLAMRSYIDLFGNRVTRVEVPAGLVTFSNRFIIHDLGELDETPPDVRTTPIADLPDDVLLFLVSSRYCDSDKLADFAWSRFGNAVRRHPVSCRRSAISFTRKSGSVIPTRAQPAAPAIPCTKASASAATSPISPSRSAAA